jgi:hypothetical protein
MLGILRMGLDDTIDGLLTLANTLFPQNDPETVRTPDENLDAIICVIKDQLSQHDLPEDIRLNDHRLRSCRSKV